MRISLSKTYQLLLSGHVVAIPTETVYGLAASIERPAAIEQIFQLKNRPSNNPLIIHIAKQSQMEPYVKTFPPNFEELAKAFWPGPLTMILPVISNSVPSQASAGLPTAAFRMPHHSLALAVMEWVGPLVMPSANISGRPSSTRREHVEADFGQNFPVLDGGACNHGLESTIIHYSDVRWQILRPGAIVADDFEPICGYVPEIAQSSVKPICPGQMYRHYAPQAHLNLCQDWKMCRGVVLGYEEREYKEAIKVFRMGKLSRPQTVAENLYDYLRKLDQEGVREVNVDIDVPNYGLWKTIQERLQKAASHN